MLDLNSLVNTGANIKLDVSLADLVEFGKRLIKEAQEEIRKELAAAKADEAETYLNTEETCKMCGVCPGTLITWEKRGYLIPDRMGRKKKFALSSIKALMRTKRRSADDVYLSQKGEAV